MEDELAALALTRMRRRRRGTVYLPAAWCGNHWDDLDRLPLNRRSVFLLLDRDREDHELIGELRKRRARVAHFLWPSGIQTVRELLVRLKPTALRQAILRATMTDTPVALSDPRPRPPISPATVKLLLKRFVASCCQRCGSARGGALYAAYLEWAQAHQVKLTRNEFGRELARLYPKSRDRRGVQYHGLRLPEAAQADRAPFLPVADYFAANESSD